MNHDFRRKLFSTYKYAPLVERVERDIREVVSNFPYLRLQFEQTDVYNTTQKINLKLQGTIPVYLNGKCYNTPIIVRISDKYPVDAPKVNVSPTYWMYIRPSVNMDEDGNVLTNVLNHWLPSVSLMSLVRELVTVFGLYPPLGSLTKLNWLDDRAEKIAKLQIEKNFVNSVKTKQDAIEVVEAYSDITVSFQKQSNVTGKTQDVLTLMGKLPENPKIEFAIHVTERYPLQPPVVRIVLAAGMRVNERCIYIDEAGLVKTPYLKNWTTTCDLLSMTKDLYMTFLRTPPRFYDSGNSGSVQGLSDSASSATLSPSSNVPGKKTVSNSSIMQSEQVSGRRASEKTDETSLGSMEYFDTHCDPCYKKNGCFIEAEGFCKKCKEYFCKNCFRSYCRYTSTKRHVILFRDKMPKQKR